MIGACAALITIPLLALSIITVSNRFPQQTITFIAISILLSSISFALPILLVNQSMFYVATFLDSDDPGAFQSVAFMKKAHTTLSFGTRSFQFGIGFLVVALFALVVVLL